MHRKRARRIWGDLKKSLELSVAVRSRRVTFASSQWPCGGCHACCGEGADGKASIERFSLPPHVEKPFNSKVIKCFVPELRSRKCFSCFGIPMFYIYIYLMKILCTFHISTSWVCYKCTIVNKPTTNFVAPYLRRNIERSYLIITEKFCWRMDRQQLISQILKFLLISTWYVHIHVCVCVF